MKLKLKGTSPVDVDEEGIVLLATTAHGRCLLGARDGAVAWTNRALRIAGEKFPRDTGAPLGLAGNERWVYALRQGSVLQRFLVAQPEPEPDAKEEPPELPEAQTTRLPKAATCIAVNADGKLVLAGPQSDDQLGRLWREDPEALPWEDLRLGRRTLSEETPDPPDAAPKKPDFTQTKSKITGPPDLAAEGRPRARGQAPVLGSPRARDDA